MTPEIVVAFLAILKIGAIVLPLFSGFGAHAIISRLGDAGAKALFTADGCCRRGRPTLLKPVADEVAAQLPHLKHLIVLRHLGVEVPWREGRDHWFHELLARARDEADAEPTQAAESKPA